MTDQHHEAFYREYDHGQTFTQRFEPVLIATEAEAKQRVEEWLKVHRPHIQAWEWRTYAPHSGNTMCTMVPRVHVRHVCSALV